MKSEGRRGFLGRGLISTQPDADCGDFDHGEVVGGELFVARRDTPELLEFVEESLGRPIPAASGGTAPAAGRSSRNRDR